MKYIFPFLIFVGLIVGGALTFLKEAPKFGASQSISSLTSYTTPLNADVFPITDTANLTTKKLSYSNLKATLITDWASQWQTLLTNSAGLASALSDESGSGLAVFSTTPTLTTPILNSATITTPYINVAGTEAKGDTLYLSDNGGTLTRLAIGNASDILSVSSGLPAWVVNPSISFPYNASSTLNATATIAADNLLNRALVLNGLAYKWPATRGNTGTGQYLSDGGTGTLVFASTTSILWATTSVATFGSALNPTIFTVVIPANTLGTSHALVGRFNVDWRTTNTTAKSIVLSFGGTTCQSTAVSPSASTDKILKGYVNFRIIETGTNTQACEVSFVGGEDVFDTGSATAWKASLVGQGTAAITQSSNQNLILSTNQGGPDTNNYMTVYNGFILYVQ